MESIVLGSGSTRAGVGLGWGGGGGVGSAVLVSLGRLLLRLWMMCATLLFTCRSLGTSGFGRRAGFGIMAWVYTATRCSHCRTLSA